MAAYPVNSLVFVLFATSFLCAVLLYCTVGLRSFPRLPTSSPMLQGHKLVTVVIAARNEAGSLGDCLESLLAQEGIARIVVVDDHSEDQTLSLARQFAAKDPRILPLAAPSVPPGWIAKSFALHHGAKEANTPLILFSDADVWFGLGLVAQSASRMMLENLDHLSGHFQVVCRTVAEEICAPVLVTSSSVALFNTANSMGSATGAFNMVRSAAYRGWGGHEPIKDQIVDDVALARHVKQLGGRSQFLFMGDRLKVRLFVGFAGFMSAVMRSSVPFLKLGAATVAVMACCLMCLMGLTVGCLFLPCARIIMPASVVQDLGFTLWFGPLPYFLGILAVCATKGFHNGRWFFILLYPVASMTLGYGVLKASVSRLCRRPIAWRGREYAFG